MKKIKIRAYVEQMAEILTCKNKNKKWYYGGKI